MGLSLRRPTANVFFCLANKLQVSVLLRYLHKQKQDADKNRHLQFVG
jgi:hypothetical protein